MPIEEDIDVEDDLETLNSKVRRRKLIERRKRFKELLDSIEDGKFESEELLPDQIYRMDATEREQVQTPDNPRKEYKSPLDRSTYNYGYETIGELGSGTENAW